jgi:hypothetical protein
MTTLPELLGQGGGSIPIWFSGRTVLKWDTVRSPADGELYTRIAADGAGTTDPADDITNYVAASYRRIPSLAPPAGNFATNSQFATYGATKVSPVISAGARTLLVSATGRGSLTFLGAAQTSGSNRTTRWEVIADGRVLLDQSLTLATSQGFAILGRTTMNSSAVEGVYTWEDSYPLEFRRSLSVYITPAIATTASTDFWAYRLRGLS